MNKTVWLPGVFFEAGKYHYTIMKAGDEGYFGEIVGSDPGNILHGLPVLYTTPTRKKVITVHRLCSRWVSQQIVKGR